MYSSEGFGESNEGLQLTHSDAVRGLVLAYTRGNELRKNVSAIEGEIWEFGVGCMGKKRRSFVD